MLCFVRMQTEAAHWNPPPVLKVLEALGALADDRVQDLRRHPLPFKLRGFWLLPRRDFHPLDAPALDGRTVHRTLPPHLPLAAQCDHTTATLTSW